VPWAGESRTEPKNNGSFFYSVILIASQFFTVSFQTVKKWRILVKKGTGKKGTDKKGTGKKGTGKKGTGKKGTGKKGTGKKGMVKKVLVKKVPVKKVHKMA
jgi:hypothetical protein